MKCFVHPDREAATTCGACGNPICQECDVPMSGKRFCKKCLAEAESVPAQTGSAGHSSAAHERPEKFALPLLLGSIAGGIAGYLTRIERSFPIGAIWGLLAFHGMLLLVIYGARLLLGRERIERGKGVLPCLGVANYAELLYWSILFAIIAGAICYNDRI